MRPLIVRWIAPSAVLVLFLLCVGIGLSLDAPTYQAFMTWLEPDAQPTPFIDTMVVLSWMECHARGIDVYLINPCDPYGNTMAQSPAWLALTFTGMTIASTNVVGILVCLGFIGTLFMLPTARKAGEALVLLAAFCSPAVILSLERANSDLIMFALIIMAARLAAGGVWVGRICGYALVVLAGLFKFYPLIAQAMALRERLPRLMAVSLATLGVLMMFVWSQSDNLLRTTVSTGAWLGSTYGAINLIAGLKVLAPGWAGVRALVVAGHVLLACAALVWMLRRGALADALAKLTEFDHCLLICGAAICLASFLLTMNGGYRAIFLLPLVVVLTRMTHGPGAIAYRVVLVGAIFLLWGLRLPHVRAAVGSSPWLQLSWLLAQTAWWVMAGLLSAILIGLAQTTPIYDRLYAFMAPRQP